MKKILLLLAALSLSAAAFAQDREIDLESLEDLNKIEIASGGKVETELNLAFPMYFGVSVLTNVNTHVPWSKSTMDLKTPKNFVYGLQLADLHLRYNVLDVSLGLRWTFMDFTFSNSEYTIRPLKNTYTLEDNYTLYPIDFEAQNYDGKKSKFHASYFGFPLRVGLKFGKTTVYAGASAEFLTEGYTKYKRPKYREQIKGAFNPFRATVEGGFSYGNLGVFVMYGLTPLFSDVMFAQANTLSFGLILGL